MRVIPFNYNSIKYLGLLQKSFNHLIYKNLTSLLSLSVSSCVCYFFILKAKKLYQTKCNPKIQSIIQGKIIHSKNKTRLASNQTKKKIILMVTLLLLKKIHTQKIEKNDTYEKPISFKNSEKKLFQQSSIKLYKSPKILTFYVSISREVIKKILFLKTENIVQLNINYLTKTFLQKAQLKITYLEKKLITYEILSSDEVATSQIKPYVNSISQEVPIHYFKNADIKFGNDNCNEFIKEKDHAPKCIPLHLNKGKINFQIFFEFYSKRYLTPFLIQVKIDQDKLFYNYKFHLHNNFSNKKPLLEIFTSNIPIKYKLILGFPIIFTYTPTLLYKNRLKS